MEQYVSRNDSKVPRRVLGALLASVSAGVVPRTGAPYIAIGRTEEITAIASDLARVADGEGAMRFVIGRYGSGKSFLMQLVRGYAAENGFVTADADLSPERRLTGSGGVGVATYRELMKNLSTKSAPDGGALPSIIARWFTSLSESLVAEGFSPASPAFDEAFEKRIYASLRSLETFVGGFDFAAVLGAYFRAYRAGDDDRMSACLRWLRGEWNTRTEAREAIGIRSLGIVTDDTWYDTLKLLAAFVRMVGYAGLCVFIDEGVNLYKITNRVSREANYEKILSMFNDTLQGHAEGLFLAFGGTPQFLEDQRRGLFSYEALRSRLSDGRFAAAGQFKSLMGPVIRLRRLSDGELYALLLRLRRLHGDYHGTEPRITDAEIGDFLTASLARAGADEMMTPREIIRDFVTLLDLLLQNPEADVPALVGTLRAAEKTESAAQPEQTEKPAGGTAKPLPTIEL